MTPRDFCYWLQGYFELTGDGSNGIVQCLAFHQKEIILKHIELVKVTPGNYDSRMVSFLGWVESALEFDAATWVIQDKLSGIFEHVIDPNTPGDSVVQNQIHSSEWGSTSGERC